MIKIIISLLTSAFCLCASGQTDPGNPLPHFVFPGFTKGVTKMKDGKVFSSNLNYNTVDEIMVTELDGKYRYAKDLESIDTILIEYKKFVPVGKVFYEVLANGPVSLFLQNKSTLTPKGSNVGYGSRSQSVGATDYKRFEMQQWNVNNQWDVVNIDLPPNMDVTPASVYWVRNDDKFEKFINLNQFYKIFPEKQAELKQFVKNEKISMKSREDLIRLVNYSNTLK
ncbi:MAG TPA: hypothetical protein VK207_00675 [Bacteroidales bacterium]|nr:hypothetical protein [Bacteroidales bacterium]